MLELVLDLSLKRFNSVMKYSLFNELNFTNRFGIHSAYSLGIVGKIAVHFHCSCTCQSIDYRDIRVHRE